MILTLVTYRTLGSDNNSFAMVPPLWLSDLIDWIRISDGDTLRTSHDYRGDPILPVDWPNYRTCLEWCKISDLVTSGR